MRLFLSIFAFAALSANADDYCNTNHPVMNLLRHCQQATGAKLPPALKWIPSQIGSGMKSNVCHNTLVQFDGPNSTVSVFKTDRNGQLNVFRYRQFDMTSSRAICLNDGAGEPYRTTSPSVESGIVAGFIDGDQRKIGVMPSLMSVESDCQSNPVGGATKEIVAEDNSGFKMVLAAFHKAIVDQASVAIQGGKLHPQFESCVTMFEDLYKRKNQDAFTDAERPIVANALSGPPSIRTLIESNPTTIESIINETGSDGP